MGTYLVYFILKVLAWEICNLKWGFAIKVIKSQRQFMYGSNFYGSHVSIFPKNWPLNYDASAEFFTTSSGKSCENLNFPANLYRTTRGALQHTQTHALDRLAIETKLGLSVVMPMLNFSQHLPGSTKCFIHVSKSETPLQNQYVLYWIEIDLKLIVPTVHTTYFSHSLFYRKSCQRIAS